MHDHLEHPEAFEVSPFHLALKHSFSADRLWQRFFAWYLFGVSGCASPILYSTVNSIVRDDSEERAVIMVSIIPGPVPSSFCSSTVLTNGAYM